MNRAEKERREIDLRGRRLNKHAIALLYTLPARPAAGNPSASSGWPATIAAGGMRNPWGYLPTKTRAPRPLPHETIADRLSRQ